MSSKACIRLFNCSYLSMDVFASWSSTLLWVVGSPRRIILLAEEIASSISELVSEVVTEIFAISPAWLFSWTRLLYLAGVKYAEAHSLLIFTSSWPRLTIKSSSVFRLFVLCARAAAIVQAGMGRFVLIINLASLHSTEKIVGYFEGSLVWKLKFGINQWFVDLM